MDSTHPMSHLECILTIHTTLTSTVPKTHGPHNQKCGSHNHTACTLRQCPAATSSVDKEASNSQGHCPKAHLSKYQLEDCPQGKTTAVL